MLEKERIWLYDEPMELFFLPRRSETRGERECENGLRSVEVWLAEVAVLAGSTSVENCLCVAVPNLAGNGVVEYCLVVIQRRLSIGVDTR